MNFASGEEVDGKNIWFKIQTYITCINILFDICDTGTCFTVMILSFFGTRPLLPYETKINISVCYQ